MSAVRRRARRSDGGSGCARALFRPLSFAGAVACALAGADCLDASHATSPDDRPGSQARVVFARRTDGGERNLWRVRLDGTGTEALSRAPEDEVPLDNVPGGGILAHVAGDGWEFLALYGEDPRNRIPVTPVSERVELVALLGTTLLFATGRDGTDMHAVDWRAPPDRAVDLFPGRGGVDRLLHVTEDGWVVAAMKDGGIAASLLGASGRRVEAVAAPGAVFAGLTNDGRVIYVLAGRLVVADPDGSSAWRAPGGGEPQTFQGLLKDDTILFEESRRLLAVRPGNAEAAVLLEGLPDGFELRVDDEDWIVAVLGGSLIRFSPRAPDEPLVLAEEAAPIGFLRLYSRWAVYKAGTLLRSVSLDSRERGTLSAAAGEIRQIVFLPGENVGLLYENDRLVTMHADGSGEVVILEGEVLRGLQVLGGGRLLIEVERGGQRDILATEGPFSPPYPIAATPADESAPLLVP